MDWALQQASTKRAVVGGFHSPLEQSVLKVLLVARSSAVVALARSVQGARLPPEWTEPLAKGRLAVVSSASTAGRLTTQLATKRNAQAAHVAQCIVVAHASPGGALADLVAQWRAEGRDVTLLAQG